MIAALYCYTNVWAIDGSLLRAALGRGGAGAAWCGGRWRVEVGDESAVLETLGQPLAVLELDGWLEAGAMHGLRIWLVMAMAAVIWQNSAKMARQCQNILGSDRHHAFNS